jgi:hypothetical protein
MVRDALESIIFIISPTEQERDRLLEKSNELNQEQRELFNFMLSNDGLFDEFLNLMYSQSDQCILALMEKAQFQMDKEKTASDAPTPKADMYKNS